MNRQSRKRFFGVLLYMLLIIVSCLVSCSIAPEEEELLVPSLVQPPRIEYEIYKVKKGDIKKIGSGTAVFVPEKYEAVYYSGAGGRLKAINVKLGDKVQKGMLLAEIDPGDSELSFKQQEIEIKKLETRLKQMAEEDSILDTNIEIARIDLEQAIAELEATPGLYNENNAKRAALRLQQLENQKRARALEKQMLAFDLEQAGNLLEFYSEQLQKTRLLSPYDSEVISVNTSLKIGDYIETGKEIVTVADLSKLVLEYTSELLGSYRTGMKAEVNYKDKVYTGEIYTFPADSQYYDKPEQRTVKAIRFKLDEPPEGVKIGDKAVFSVELEKRENVIVIPRSALRTIQDKSMVEVVKGNQKKEVYVEIGMVTDTMVEIRDGLEEGQEIIIR